MLTLSLYHSLFSYNSLVQALELPPGTRESSLTCTHYGTQLYAGSLCQLVPLAEAITTDPR